MDRGDEFVGFDEARAMAFVWFLFGLGIGLAVASAVWALTWWLS